MPPKFFSQTEEAADARRQALTLKAAETLKTMTPVRGELKFNSCMDALNCAAVLNNEFKRDFLINNMAVTMPGGVSWDQIKNWVDTVLPAPTTDLTC